MVYSIASLVQQQELCSKSVCAAWQVPTLLARAAGMPEGMLNNGLSGHQHRAANKAVSGLKVKPTSGEDSAYCNYPRHQLRSCASRVHDCL